MLQILTTLMMAFPMAQAHEIEATCTDVAFDQAVNYCFKLYRRRSQAFAHCKLGAAHTYEAILLNEVTTNREICKPYFMRECDSGRKLMIAKNSEHCGA